MPETSIIIVTHNGLRETTAPCLESIFTNGGGKGDFEVIVVDNDSSDETPGYLRAMLEREPRLRCIFNKSNRGFAGGNNDGLKIASGEVLILLNSDCIVTKNWIECLSALLKDPEIGLAGPASNSTGNEQRVFTGGQTPGEIIEEGLTWVSHSLGARFETDMLTFFCVAMRRDVFDRVGWLDENFGLGFYEDDDYCIRAKRAGYKLICAEDVFVYHRGGGSFGRIGNDTRKLMKENLRKLEKKHAFRIKRDHPRERQLRVIQSYLVQVRDGAPSPQLQYRISNRIIAIESQMPRGIFKKWALKRRLARLKETLGRHGVFT